MGVVEVEEGEVREAVFEQGAAVGECEGAGAAGYWWERERELVVDV